MRTESSQETQAFAKAIAERVQKQSAVDHAVVLALTGDLGSGKTTFTQGFFKALGITQHITSPTFLIFKKYPLSSSQFENAYHVDLYRVEEHKELDVLKFIEILRNPKNVVVIEWAERIRDTLPSDAMWIQFEHTDHENARILKTDILSS